MCPFFYLSRSSYSLSPMRFVIIMTMMRMKEFMNVCNNIATSCNAIIDRVRLAKGFILNKMYFHGYVCRKIGHGKHTSVDNLGKSCPSELRPFLGTAIQELESKNRLLITWPTRNSGMVVSIMLVSFCVATLPNYRRIERPPFVPPSSERVTRLRDPVGSRHLSCFQRLTR